MTPSQIRVLLAPFLEGDTLSDQKTQLISIHLELLLKWSERVNLTSLTDPAEILTRHFGESLFAARKLSDGSQLSGSLIDLGSGAGFPGIPIKIWVPELQVTLVESQQKKATFLREAARTLGLPRLDVANRRAEELGWQADLVALRAVEKFDSSLQIAARLVRKGGRLALLIGAAQVPTVNSFLAEFWWSDPIPMPLSNSRVILVGRAPE